MPSVGVTGSLAAATIREKADSRRRRVSPTGSVAAPGQEERDCEEGGEEEETAEQQCTAVELEAPDGVELAHRSHRGQGGEEVGAGHGEGHATDDDDGPLEDERADLPAAGAPEGTQHDEVGCGPVEQLGQPLSGQQQEGESGETAEDGQGDRLWTDGLLHLLMHRVELAEGE